MHYKDAVNFCNCFVRMRVILFVEKSDVVGNKNLTHEHLSTADVKVRLGPGKN